MKSIIANVGAMFLILAGVALVILLVTLMVRERPIFPPVQILPTKTPQFTPLTYITDPIEDYVKLHLNSEIVNTLGITGPVVYPGSVISINQSLDFDMPVNPYQEPEYSLYIYGVSEEEDLDARVQRLENHYESLSSQLDEIRRSIFSVSDLSAQNYYTGDLDLVQEKLNVQDDRIEELVGLVQTDPERAIEVALLNNSVENLEEQVAASISLMSDEADRLYDLMKWFLGIQGTALLLMIGIVLSNFYKPRNIEKKDDDKPADG